MLGWAFPSGRGRRRPAGGAPHVGTRAVCWKRCCAVRALVGKQHEGVLVGKWHGPVDCGWGWWSAGARPCGSARSCAAAGAPGSPRFARSNPLRRSCPADWSGPGRALQTQGGFHGGQRWPCVTPAAGGQSGRRQASNTQPGTSQIGACSGLPPHVAQGHFGGGIIVDPLVTWVGWWAASSESEVQTLELSRLPLPANLRV